MALANTPSWFTTLSGEGLHPHTHAHIQNTQTLHNTGSTLYLNWNHVSFLTFSANQHTQPSDHNSWGCHGKKVPIIHNSTRISKHKWIHLERLALVISKSTWWYLLTRKLEWFRCNLLLIKLLLGNSMVTEWWHQQQKLSICYQTLHLHCSLSKCVFVKCSVQILKKLSLCTEFDGLFNFVIIGFCLV